MTKNIFRVSGHSYRKECWIKKKEEIEAVFINSVVKGANSANFSLHAAISEQLPERYELLQTELNSSVKKNKLPEWLEEEDPQGNTLLYYAVIRSDLEAIKKLTEYGSNVNGSCRGFSLLHHAILKWDKSDYKLLKNVMEYLLAKGIDPNKQDYYGDTALHYAFQYGLSELAAVLVKNGADPLIKYKTGNNPSFWISRFSDTLDKFLKFIILTGAREDEMEVHEAGQCEEAMT